MSHYRMWWRKGVDVWKEIDGLKFWIGMEMLWVESDDTMDCALEQLWAMQEGIA